MCRYNSLWGNRSDLSLNPEGVKKEDIKVHHEGKEAILSKILIDDGEAIWHFLSTTQRPSKTVVFIMDNAGFELVCDLLLADALTASGIADTILFHFKGHPT